MTTASQELQTAVQTLLTSTSQRGLLATIKDEQIVPGAKITSSSSSFTSDLSNLSTHVTSKEALYILLRRADELSSGDKSLCAITYVPNAAPVRQKMLFASTRLTLLRELGGEHFPETVFCTEADELTEEGWARHLAHEKEKNPLTKEEQDLEDIKHAESLESRGTQGRSLTQGGKLALRADSDIASALSTLGEGGRENLVQLRMDGKTETLQLASVSSASPSSLATAIDASEPRFSFYRYDDAEDSIVFVSTCPSKAKIKDRMLYAASRSNVLLLAQNEGGLKVAKRIEATNPEEVTEAVLREEFKTADVEEKKSFAKPKRPGRK